MTRGQPKRLSRNDLAKMSTALSNVFFGRPGFRLLCPRLAVCYSVSGSLVKQTLTAMSTMAAFGPGQTPCFT